MKDEVILHSVHEGSTLIETLPSFLSRHSPSSPLSPILSQCAAAAALVVGHPIQRQTSIFDNKCPSSHTTISRNSHICLPSPLPLPIFPLFLSFPHFIDISTTFGSPVFPNHQVVALAIGACGSLPLRCLCTLLPRFQTLQ